MDAEKNRIGSYLDSLDKTWTFQSNAKKVVQ